VGQYLEFIRRRATGEVLTTASFIRNFVTSHPEYQGDSVVSSSIAYDLVVEAKAIGEGRKRCPELLGDVVVEPIVTEEAYDVLLTANKVVGKERADIISHYLRRAAWHGRRQDFFSDADTFAASK